MNKLIVYKIDTYNQIIKRACYFIPLTEMEKIKLDEEDHKDFQYLLKSKSVGYGINRCFFPAWEKITIVDVLPMSKPEILVPPKYMSRYNKVTMRHIYGYGKKIGAIHYAKNMLTWQWKIILKDLTKPMEVISPYTTDNSGEGDGTCNPGRIGTDRILKDSIMEAVVVYPSKKEIKARVKRNGSSKVMVEPIVKDRAGLMFDDQYLNDRIILKDIPHQRIYHVKKYEQLWQSFV